MSKPTNFPLGERLSNGGYVASTPNFISVMVLACASTGVMQPKAVITKAAAVNLLFIDIS
jgi:hypothetical protein